MGGLYHELYLISSFFADVYRRRNGENFHSVMHHCRNYISDTLVD